MDFSYWDLKDKFTLVEAALLWTEQSPDYIFGSLKVKGEAAKVFDVLLEAVEKKELTLDFGNAVTREELTDWARRKCPKNDLPTPKFLFSKGREDLDEEEATSEEATKVAQESYDRTPEDTRKRNEFAGVVKTILVICPDRCKSDSGKITVDGVYETIKKISKDLWGVKKPILKERVAKAIIDKLLKDFSKR
jgi:hypothetical protein